MTSLIPVMDIGGTHVTAALFDPATRRVEQDRRCRRPLDASASAAEILEQLARCGNAADPPPGAPWGVALPGPFDYARGVGLYEGVKFDALRGVDVRTALHQNLRPVPGGIRFLNDADAFGLGEWASGAAAGHDRAVALTLGTGIGSTFLDRGRVVEAGHGVPPEGRADLLTIDGRPLEETVSRRALLARYAFMTGRNDPGVDVQDVAQRARDGDRYAAETLSEAFHALGGALRPWVERFRATVVVVGGSMAGSWDLLAEPLTAGLRTHDGVAVLRGQHQDDAALIGAGLHALGGGGGL